MWAKLITDKWESITLLAHRDTKFIAEFMSGPYHDLTKQFGHFWQDVRLCVSLSLDLIVLQLYADNNMLDVTFISSSSLSNHPSLHSLNIRASKFGPLLKFSTGGSYVRQNPGQASDWSIMASLWLVVTRHQRFLGHQCRQVRYADLFDGPRLQRE